MYTLLGWIKLLLAGDFVLDRIQSFDHIEKNLAVN